MALLLFSVSSAGVASAYYVPVLEFLDPNGDTWSYSPIGSASTTPTEGSAQAWRFDASSPSVPSLAPADQPAEVFDIACAWRNAHYRNEAHCNRD